MLSVTSLQSTPMSDVWVQNQHGSGLFFYLNVWGFSFL